MAATLEAQAAAEGKLIAAHLEEFEELFRVELLTRGLELVTVRKVSEKRVSESEAITLEKFGWERV